MLSAVQDMCVQQRTVVAAQKVAIAELSRECGMDIEEASNLSGCHIKTPATASKVPSAPPAVEAAASGQTAAAKAAAQQKVEADLQGLLAEKEKFEGMLADSQTEHEDLLKRLNDMRSLMGALGMDLADDVEK